MSTTTEQIAEMIQSNAALIEYFTGIQNRVDAAIAALPEHYRVWYVDQTNGSDLNNGDSNNPFASIEEALSNTPINGACRVMLYDEYSVDTNIGLNGRDIQFVGADGNARLSFVPENLSDDANYAPGFSPGNKKGVNHISFSGVDLTFSSTPSSIPQARRGIIHPYGMTFVNLHNLEISMPSTSNQFLIDGGLFGVLNVGNVVVDPDMPGHWVSTAAAGTDPATLELFHTNLTSL